ncbi:MAG TPA: AraC family transcriptional regulator ligand-binding domain-containing protein [Steroidobacteraceae bacterium]
MKRNTRLPRALGVMTRLAFAHARAHGIATAPLLARAGLSRRQIEDPKVRIRVRDQVEFLNLVATAAKDDVLGFHLAHHCELRTVGLYFYVLASSETVKDVCERGARYSGLINEGVTQHLVDDAQIGIRTQFTSFSRIDDRHQVEFWTVALVRMLRQFTGTRLIPRLVSFMHPRKRAVSEMCRYFGCEVQFGAAVDEVIFEKGAGKLPVVNSDPHLNRVLVAICEDTLTRDVASRASVRTRVENEIATLLPHGKARAALVATRLGMSQRTLARHLADQGSSFSALLARIRRDLASRYLEDESLPISQIAWLLGFQDPGAFSHAFKRWHGTAPRHAAVRVR